MIYFIFDNFELLRSWDKNSNIVPLLLRIHETLKIPDVGIIYISSSTPDAHYLCAGSIEPITIYFPDYTLEDLHGIFMRNQHNPKLYSSFLSHSLESPDELSLAFQPLFQKYCKLLVDQSVVPDEAMKRKLFDNLQPYLTVSLNDFFMALSRSSHQIEQEGDHKKKGIRKSNRKEYLLLSAFIASRNPATLDASLFDSSGGLINQKRNNMAEEILLKGPGSFPLERLLAIFQCITSVSESMVEEEQCENGAAIESESVGLTSDVLLQFSALCNANFIGKSGRCPLEGSTRYRCTIDEEMAIRVAKRINFPLSSYLYRR
ncbi:hypothetical protein KFK09_005305 [Dendrobium nobile]|uniref:Origin recognition complex subunit 5 C-terminal domain-containing protein n=1 Tax=Dendrobium nobile TaxID=94219 RepID=A0A8T3C0Y1_DENNO|nr:hypothetical protein KFK09_005305 [Dendrobium nobile]